jgi:hypothetical protein
MPKILLLEGSRCQLARKVALRERLPFFEREVVQVARDLIGVGPDTGPSKF